LKNIAAIGEILWDNFPDGKELGGAPTNFAIMSKYIGSNAFVISAVGDDFSGKEILEKLHQIGINTDLLQINPNYKTGEVNISVDNAGNPKYEIIENRACDHIHYSEKMDEFTGKFDAICFGSLSHRSEDSKQTIFKFLHKLDKKCLKVCDLNIRQNYYNKNLINDLLEISDVFKINYEEKSLLENIFKVNLNKAEDCKKFLLEKDLQVLIITNGEIESEIITLNEYSKLNSKKINVVDTVGAGDSFLAGFVHGYLKKLPIELIHRNAIELSAKVCESKGALGIL